MIVNRDGLGTTMPTSSLISSAVGVAGGTVAAVASTGALLAIGIGAQAVPIIGTIVGGIALAVAALGIGNGCGETCTASTAVVNKIEPYLKQNVQAAGDQASANGGCLTSAEQQTLVANFNQLWQYVVDNCNQVGGPGGKQCVADRIRGGKWDWFVYYLDPIMAIPVCPPPSVVQSAATSLANATGLKPSWIMYGGIGLLALLLLGGKD